MITALLLTLSVVSTLGAGVAVDRAAVASAARARAVWAVVAVHAVALPVIAWAGVRATDLGAAGAGIVVAAAAPGGSTGPLLALLARGDAALAAALFLVLTLVGTVTALAATLAFDVAGVAAVARASAIVVATGVAPLVAGIAARARRPTLAARAAPWLSRLGAALLVATIAGLALEHGDRLATPAVLAIAAAVVVASLAPALAIAPRARALAVAQVGAVRNLTLALVVLAAVGAPGEALGAALSYGLVMYVVTIGIAVVARRTPAAPQAPQAILGVDGQP
jgi:BASS family bile acid:Na+ symporter